jgi:acetolactate synthase-1/2/3 large subunit
VREEYVSHLRDSGLLEEGPPVSTPAVLRTVREVVPTGAVVTTDIGGHRIWSKNNFPAHERTGFVTPGSWAGMGVGLPSAIGARLANPDRPVVTLSGDGSLMMCTQALHTAAERDLDLTVVLFNDSDYGIISKSIDAADGRRFAWSSPDWAAIAEGFGCEARGADTRTAVRDAVQWALETAGPTLVDVDVDPQEPSASDLASRASELEPASF